MSSRQQSMETKSTQTTPNHPTTIPIEYQNICPGCGYNMGTNWFSQYCSRKCMFSRIRHHTFLKQEQNHDLTDLRNTFKKKRNHNKFKKDTCT